MPVQACLPLSTLAAETLSQQRWMIVMPLLAVAKDMKRPMGAGHSSLLTDAALQKPIAWRRPIWGISVPAACARGCHLECVGGGHPQALQCGAGRRRLPHAAGLGAGKRPALCRQGSLSLLQLLLKPRQHPGGFRMLALLQPCPPAAQGGHVLVLAWQ